MKRRTKIAVWAPVTVVGLFAFNLFFVSGGSHFFDCRVTAAADANGCGLVDDGSMFNWICSGGYPATTLCPVDTPRTVEECKALYEVYTSLVDDPISYPWYTAQRCHFGPTP